MMPVAGAYIGTARLPGGEGRFATPSLPTCISQHVARAARDPLMACYKTPFQQQNN